MLKLHAFDRSPFGWKARIVLAEKKVPYAWLVPENKNENPEFAKLNPFKLTPVLELEDGRTVYELTIVNEFLEDMFPDPPMMPKDAYEKARVRMLEDTTDQHVIPAVRELVLSQFVNAPPKYIRKKAGELDAAAKEAAENKVRMHLDRLERELASRKWFGGDIFSLADAALVPPIVMTLPLIGVLPDARYPNLAAWAKRVVERPSYEASKPKVPPSIEG